MILEAVFRGYLDCREADFDDPAWWLKVKLATEYVKRSIHSQVATLQYRQQLSLTPLLRDEASFGTWWEAVETNRRSLALKLMPWLADYDLKSEMQSMTEQYRQTFGDPKDPAFQAEMQALLDYWHGGGDGDRSTAAR